MGTAGGEMQTLSGIKMLTPNGTQMAIQNLKRMIVVVIDNSPYPGLAGV